MTEAWSRWEGHVVKGEFHLKKYLGGSEQSAVFLTEYQGAQPQPAAIKLVAAPPANANLQLSRWELAQRLAHPHLIRLFRSGRCQLDTRELIFVVMEYGEENLAQILLERPLTSQEAGDMLMPTLDALAYLHSQGFIHGHLKPANILAIKDQLKLASDTICKTNETSSDPGQPSVYDPPEIGCGIGPAAADVWSLGMTVAEVLTQRLPFWIPQDESDPVLPENLPAPFLEIVRGCLRRDPKFRLTIAGISARLFSGSPQPAPAAVATTSPQNTLPQKAPAITSQKQWPIRRFAFPGMVVVAAFAVSVLAGLGLLHRPQPAQPEVTAAKPEKVPDAQEPGAGKPSPITPSHKMKSETVQQPDSSGNRFEATPAALRSEAPGPASVVQKVLPNVPQSASHTIQGTIRIGVNVNVDAAGNVVAADLAAPGPSRYFARLSLEAAQRWKFVPSSRNSGREFVLHFEFKNSGASAYATQAGG